MMKRYPIFLAALLAGQVGWTQVDLEDSGVYLREDTNTLHIPSGAVLGENGEVLHYRNIELRYGEGGDFEVANAERGELIPVETVEVLVERAQDTVELEVWVEGGKSACVEPIDPVVIYENRTFTVALPESQPISEVCILVLEPYRTSFTLEPGELESGSYTVVVNGVAEQFTLQDD